MFGDALREKVTIYKLAEWGQTTIISYSVP